jgi:iron complex transport system permease protein
MRRYYFGIKFSILLLLIFVGAYWMIAEHQSHLSNVLYWRSAVNFKLPRVLMDVLSGALFAIAGAILQDTMRNKITSPDILGISSLSILSVLLSKNYFPQINWPVLSLIALLAAGLSFCLLYLIAQRNGRLSVIKFVLIGTSISIVCKAGIQWLLQHSSPLVVGSLSYMVGSTYGVSWERVFIVAIVGLPFMALAILNFPFFKYFSLSDERAQSIGIRLGRIRKLNISLAIVCTVIAVMGIGNLGFVGLVAPNIARAICRNNKLWLLIYSAMLGAVLVVMAEALASWVFYPIEVPVGVVTTVIGAPYFIWVVHKYFN